MLLLSLAIHQLLLLVLDVDGSFQCYACSLIPALKALLALLIFVMFMTSRLGSAEGEHFLV